MLYGWSGKMLRIDLSTMKSWVEDTEPYIPSFIGGKGLSVKIIYDELGPEIGPFDSENRICFSPGILSGTMAPAHSRMKITSVAPNGYLQNSGTGGYIPAEIKKAGYDNVIVQGKSEKPVYLYVNNENVEIRDATHIWGMDTQAAQRVIKEEIGDLVKIACIGPAGENLVSISCIITGVGSVAGHGGLGAIMGAKNLKAIAFRGTGQVRIARPSEFLKLCKETHLWMRETPGMKAQSREGQGDKGLLEYSYQSGQGVLGNFEEKDASWDNIGDFGSGDEFYAKYGSHQYGCYGCPVHHFHVFDIPGKCRGAVKCSGWYDFSGPVWVSDRKVIAQAFILCNSYGLDSASTGNAVSFLMELYHRGIISENDTDGIPMRRGDEKAIFAAIEKIAKQEGFGKLFRDGVWGAAKEIGKEAEECAVLVNKQTLTIFEVRAFKSAALAATLGDGIVRFGGSVHELEWGWDKERMEKEAQECYGSKEAAIPYSYEKKALSVWDNENRNTVIDMLGTCFWVIQATTGTIKLDIPVELLSLATGRDIGEEELLWAAQRVLTLERACKVRRGRGRDRLPRRLFETAVPDGIFKGERLSEEKFEEMLDEYYSLRGWDENGVPKVETFMKFGLLSEWKIFDRHLKSEG